MPSSLSVSLGLFGIILVLAGVFTLGVVVGALGLALEAYIFYKGGVT